MSSTDNTIGEPVITIQPATPIVSPPSPSLSAGVLTPLHNSINLTATIEPKRRVSIVTDPISEGRLGVDNLGFEQNPRRKISQQSEHSEVGPTRRKSILHNNTGGGNIDAETLNSHEPRHNNVPHKKHSTTESVNSKNYGNHKLQQDNLEQSWIFSLCMRCRADTHTPSWEPPHYQKVCPYPLCPSYRQFARIVTLILIIALIWITTYAILGDTAAPGGQLFQLVVLTIAANFGGWIISLTTLPRLIGMLLVGILLQNIQWINFEESFSEVTAELRKFALVIILTRAGLEMDPEAFKKVYLTILKLGLVPWTVECVVVAVMSHFLIDLPWMWGFLLGSIIAAVSPAVVVPCLFRLRTKGYGVAKGIPTLIIAVAGIDDAASVAIFGIIASIMFSSGSVGYQIAQAPVCVLGGLGYGVIWGFLSRFVPERNDAYVVPLRTLMLFSGGLLAVFGSERIGFEGAGPLAVVFAAFTSNLFWCKQGWDVEDNPVSTAFEIFWMVFEPILFGITGASVKFRELDIDIVTLGIACIVAGVVIRIIATVSIAIGDKLNLKEKIFVAFSWMAKATVQAALGPVALRHILKGEGDPTHAKYAEIVQMICILSIVLTAPLGAIIISISGTKLLTKTKQPQILEGWRRSHRPSLRDISIIDEEEERDDLESRPDEETQNNTNSNIYTVTNGNGTKATFYWSSGNIFIQE